MNTQFLIVFAAEKAKNITNRICEAFQKVNEDARTLGGVLGRRNEPPPNVPIDAYLFPIITAAETISLSAKEEVIALRTELDGMKEQLTLDIAEKEAEKEDLIKSIDLKEAYSHVTGSVLTFLKFPVVILLTFLVFVGDVAFTITAFEMFREDRLLTNAIGLSVAIMIVMVHRAVSSKVEIPGRFGKLLNGLISTTVLVCMVFAVNEIRISSMPAEIVEKTSTAFIAISIGCALVIDFSLSQLPQKADVHSGWQTVKSSVELSRMKVRLAKLERIIPQQKLILKKVINDLNALWEFEQNTNALVYSLLKKGVSILIIENIKHRKDRHSDFFTKNPDILNQLNN